jgi:hypothetical protein
MSVAATKGAARRNIRRLKMEDIIEKIIFLLEILAVKGGEVPKFTHRARPYHFS